MTGNRHGTAVTKRSRAGEWWCSPEYKRLQRQRKAEREGRAFRPGVPGRAPSDTTNERKAAKAARLAWREWIDLRAPKWWLEAAHLVKLQVQADQCRRHNRWCVRPEYYAERKRLTRRLLRQQADGSLPIINYTQSVNHDGACAYCRRPVMFPIGQDRSPMDATVDHVVPLSRGGAHGVGNVVIACRSCNSSKGDMTMHEWLSSEHGSLRVRLLRPDMPDACSHAT